MFLAHRMHNGLPGSHMFTDGCLKFRHIEVMSQESTTRITWLAESITGLATRKQARCTQAWSSSHSRAMLAVVCSSARLKAFVRAFLYSLHVVSLRGRQL